MLNNEETMGWDALLDEYFFFTDVTAGNRMELSQGGAGLYPVYGGNGVAGERDSPGCPVLAAASADGKKSVRLYVEQ